MWVKTGHKADGGQQVAQLLEKRGSPVVLSSVVGGIKDAASFSFPKDEKYLKSSVGPLAGSVIERVTLDLGVVGGVDCT